MKLVIDKKYVGIFLLALIMAFLYCNDKREETKIEQNKGASYAKILGIKKGKGSYVSCKFRYNHKWHYDTELTLGMEKHQ